MKVAIAGAGAVGRSIARELVENSHDVTLIERNADHVDIDSIPAVHWRLGDACELSLLEEVHLEEFDVVIAATGDDKANLATALLAKSEFGVDRVVARVNETRNEPLFTEAWGVDFAVCTASDLTSEATTAKPRPASPARAASIVALSASRLVCPAMLRMRLTISPIS